MRPVFHGGDRLEFRNNDELRAYYEQKYASGGYDGDGYMVAGFNVSKAYHAARMASVLSAVSEIGPKKVLDAGCGDGELAIRLGVCRDVTAVDIAERAFQDAKTRFPTINFRQMDVERLDFNDGSFDAVVSVETLEHVPHPVQALSEISRVVRKGGHLVLTYPLINHTLVRRWGIAPPNKISEHLNEFTRKDLEVALDTAGFDIQKTRSLVFDFGPLLLVRKLGYPIAVAMTKVALALRWFPGNSMFLMVVAKKR